MVVVMSRWDKPPPLESEVQSDILGIGVRRRWFCAKVEFKSFRGGMDTVFVREGRTIWIEVKRRGEDARRQQEIRAKQMRDHGAEVFLVDTVEEAAEILR